jgi:hypothetical protein
MEIATVHSAADTINHRNPPLSLRFWPSVILVWGSWLSMFLAALAFVRAYSNNVPFWDDWEMISFLTGKEPVTARWLWSPYHEHRIVLPKLIQVMLARLFGGDLRAGMYLNACGLGVLAGVLILAARKQRGWTSYCDAFFPLALLHWGHWPNLLWSFTVHFVSTTILAGLLLSVIARKRDPLAHGPVVLAGFCLLLLPLTGSTGLVVLPPIALWLVVSGVTRWSSTETHGRRDAIILLSLATSLLFLVGLYFLGFRRHVYVNPPGLRTGVRTAVMFLCSGLGSIGWLSWPLSGWLIAGLITMSSVCLALVSSYRPEERLRALGLFSFLGAMILLAIGVGWARGGGVPERGFSPHYVTLAALTFCCIYLIWGIDGMPRGRSMQAGLFFLMCILLPINFREGIQEGRRRHARMELFENDVRAGISPYLLADRHIPFLLPYSRKEYFAERLRMLRSAGFGQYASLNEDPPPSVVSIPVQPAAGDQPGKSSHMEHGHGQGTSFVFSLPNPRFVYAIRVKYRSDETTTAPQVINVSWQRSDRKDGPVFLGKLKNFNSYYMGNGETTLPLDGSQGEKSIDASIYDSLDQLQVKFNLNSKIRLSELVLMVPASENPAPPRR